MQDYTYIPGMDEKVKESLKDRQARQAIEGVEAMADYRAAEQASIAKTTLLREARLAREAIPVVIVPAAPKKKRTKRVLPLP